MKTVFDNRQCAHIWAQQNQPNGRGSKGSIYFEGKTIYSYGRHFPMASFLNDHVVLVNSDSYSISTSKHQNYVSYAINHKERAYASTAVLKAAADWYSSDTQRKLAIAQALKRDTLETVEIHLETALTKRMKKSKAAEVSKAIGAIQRAGNVYSAIGIPMPKELQSRLDLLTAENSDILEQFKAQKDKEAKAAERKRKAQEKKIAAAVLKAAALWQDHKPLLEVEGSGYLFTAEKIYMRVNYGMGEPVEIETTKGARFPVKDAIKAFKLIKKAKDAAKDIDFHRPENGGKFPRLGAFHIDCIHKEGNVRAGCHFVEWDQVEYVARILKIYP